MVGENDIKYLFIYSIDEEIPEKYRYLIELNKGWYRVCLCTPWCYSFLF